MEVGLVCGNGNGRVLQREFLVSISAHHHVTATPYADSLAVVRSGTVFRLHV